MDRLSVILIGFSVLCLITAFFLGNVSSRTLLQKKIPTEETILGPIRIPEDNTVLSLQVKQLVPLMRWNFVSISLLDEKRQYLTGFGDEFWHEEGRDSDGYWRESERDYRAKVTVQEAGKYFLKVTPETNMTASERRGEQIYVRANAMPFSAIPHFATAILALVAGLIMNFASGGFIYKALTEG